MRHLFRILIISQLFVVGFFSSCSKELITDEQLLEYYNTNRQNSLDIFSTIMYNDSAGKRQELFKLVHFSDAHVSTWSSGNNVLDPYNIKEAVRFANDPETKINALVSTGDHISNNVNTSHEEALKFMNIFSQTLYDQNNIPTFPSTGNHDANMMNPEFKSYALSKIDLYNNLTVRANHKLKSSGTENYYYADVVNPMGGTIRIISLDVTDQDELVFDAQHNAILSQKQIDWLCNTALKTGMTVRHSVIVLIHHPLPPADEEVRKAMLNEHLYNWNMVPEIIEAFRSKTTLNKKYNNHLLDTDNITIDVSFENSPGEFICYLGGHIHTFLQYEVASYGSTLPNQLMIIANNMCPTDKSPTSPIQRSNIGLRNNTFNLYAIDTKRKIIYTTFFGATAFYYPQALTYKYL
ncbi:MAG: metallophosphoesterase [Tannerella sp.]|jgi:hypothetical protein|nr:metallophosphoesterase [Tannerella sp.]